MTAKTADPSRATKSLRRNFSLRAILWNGMDKRIRARVLRFSNNELARLAMTTDGLRDALKIPPRQWRVIQSTLEAVARRQTEVTRDAEYE